MALTWNQVNALTEKKWLPKLVDNIFDSDPLLARSKSEGWYTKEDGGTSIMQPLLYASLTAAGWYQGADTLSTADNETFTAAEFAWKQLYVNVTISRRDELINSGDAAKIKLVESKLQVAEKTMKDYLGDGLYNAGTDSKAIGGLRHIVSTSNTVGGIAQGTYSWWQAEVDSSTTTLTLSALQTMDSNLTIDGEGPTVWIATRANYNRLYALLQPQQRFVDQKTAKAGFTSLMFNGKPYIVGSKVPANYIFALNEKYLKLVAHKDEDMRMSKFLDFTNQNARTAKLYWMGNLTSSNNRMHGVFSAVAA